YNLQSPVVTVPSSSPAKIEPQEDDIAIKTPNEDQSPIDSVTLNTQARKPRKRRWNGDETEKVL
ncbi:unnamed protein product, partial [Rotaria magnacalcarata]